MWPVGRFYDRPHLSAPDSRASGFCPATANLESGGGAALRCAVAREAETINAFFQADSRVPNFSYKLTPSLTFAWEWRRIFTAFRNQRFADEQGEIGNLPVAYTF